MAHSRHSMSAIILHIYNFNLNSVLKVKKYIHVYYVQAVLKKPRTLLYSHLMNEKFKLWIYLGYLPKVMQTSSGSTWSRILSQIKYM